MRPQMKKLVRDLEADGWRVRKKGGWPRTLAGEARWDFCCTQDTLFPMTKAAGEALNQLWENRGYSKITLE
jgi:hypothetical protein